MTAPAATIAISVLGLLWLGIAAFLAVIAARRFRLAESVLDAARANASLLELAPARPLLVHADDHIEADAQLLRDLGLQEQPHRLVEMVGNDSGIAPDDLVALKEDIEAARISGRTRAQCAFPRNLAPVVLRHERKRGGPGQYRAPASPD
jgi:hypothetical protein